MKKILVLVISLMLLGLSSEAMAGKWQMQVNGGVDILASNFNPNYSVGIGIGLGVGYVVNENWSFWLNSNGYLLPSKIADITNIQNEGILSAKYTFSGTGVNPYLRIGLGTYTDIYSVGGFSYSSSNFMLQGTLGLQIPAGDALDFIIETQGGIILATGATAVDIPVNVGLLFGL
jgi:hypothetical protein